MDVLKTIPPGQPGTQRFQRKYGERLVLVRYRHDAARQRRVTTVEIIVDEAPFQPRRPLDRELFPHGNRLVHVRVAYGESDLRQKVPLLKTEWVQSSLVHRWKNNERKTLCEKRVREERFLILATIPL